MRIHGHEGTAVNERDKVAGANGGTEGATRAHEAPRSDAVVVSTAAGELATQAARGHAARAERIAKVRAAVKDGSYRADLDRLAEKFVDEELGGPLRPPADPGSHTP